MSIRLISKRLFNLTMRKRSIRILTLTLLIIISGLLHSVRAYNMRQTFSGDGLSNSAILSLCLDDSGRLWIGTCDGVNIANGAAVQPFKTLFPERTLSGNVIESIKDGGDSYMWILTNYSLDLFNTKTWELKTFPQFHGQEVMWVNKATNRMYVVTEDSGLNVYDPGKDSDFRTIGRLSQSHSELRCIMERDGMLWSVFNEGVCVYDLTKATADNGGNLAPAKEYSHIKTRYAKCQGDELLTINQDGYICEIMPDGSERKIASIGTSATSRGRISNMVHDRQGNFFVSFFTDGALWVGRNEQKEYMAIDLGLHVGVFSLEMSPDQDVVWIGSDCQGVYTFWDDDYSIHSYDFVAMGNKISHPVRSILLDDNRNLWIGTKGDGLLRIPDLDQANPRASLSKGYLFTSANSELLHNSVFAFSKSSRPILWIGTDEGLNYYSYIDNKIHALSMAPRVRNIHAIYEENDTTIWLTTLGIGVIKVTLDAISSVPKVDKVKIYSVDDGKYSMNQFFSLSVSDSGRVLFCNRGKGIYELKDGDLKQIPLKNDFGTNVVKDVFVAIQSGDVLWLGTGEGLIKVGPGGEKRYSGYEDGFANNTIHDMLRVNNGDLWISTNYGIVRFDPATERALTFGKSYGLSVTEYSDGAAFYNGKGMIFGGINGITFISRHLSYTAPPEYKPDLTFMKLSISGKDVPMVDYLEGKDGKMKIVLAPDENYFSLMVSAPDFVNAHNYVYSYSLDGVNWIDNGPNTTISFNGMAYGKYNLSVRYMNRATGIESEPSVIEIVVNAPWYLSGWAKMIYMLLFLGLIAMGVIFYLRRQRERQKEVLKSIEQTHKEELYEEKLRFFTNITHEFCTPLTLIYGPCERILDYPGSDDYIKRYVGLVRSNAERLNTLIQELIDFRRMETGHKQLKLSVVGISGLCSDIVTSFSELADRNNVTLVEEIAPDIDWVTDFSGIRKIMTNLISNAFKYTPSGGTIKIGLKVDGGKLRLSVYNTGKGISAEEKQRIFNRYSVLDNVEENAVKGLSSRNGLGLAICHSMVDLLNGKISIDSEVGKYADFIVELPPMELPAAVSTDNSSPASGLTSASVTDKNVSVNQPEGTDPSNAMIPEETKQERSASDSDQENQEQDQDAVRLPSKENKRRVLVVDDNREILLLLRDALSEYDVITVDSADKALDIIRKNPPELIVSDIMMPGTDGVTFTRLIKQNKHTMHIPLVLLSAKTSTAEKVEGIDSGADAYVGKPFSLDYLQAVVRRLIENRDYLKQYYTTGASVYGYSDGHLLHHEDKDFMEQVINFIDDHVGDEDLGPEKVAAHMKISVRNLYRKFKELDQLPPNDFIKHQRVSYAARLLVTSSATVQEVIYRSGFTNRSHFYKEFDKRFGMTPKNYRATNASKDLSLNPDDKDE